MRHIKLYKPRSILDYSILLLVAKTIWQSSNVIPYNNSFDTFLSVAAAIFLVLWILLQHYSPSRLLCYGLITMLSLYTTYRVGDFAILISILTILAISGKGIDRILDFIYCWERMFLILNVLLWLITGLLGAEMRSMVNSEWLFNFGFVHPNFAGVIFSNLFCIWLWRRNFYLPIDAVAKSTVFIIVIYTLTGSRTVLLTCICALVMVLLKEKSKKFRRLVIMISPYTPAILTLVFYCLIVNFDLNISKLIDIAMSGRIRLGAYAYSNVGLTFFGQSVNQLFNVTWDTTWRLNSFTFDCLYTMLMMKYGCIWVGLICIAFHILAKRKNYKVCAMLFLWSLSGIAEVHCFNCYLFFPLLLVTLLLDKKNFGENNCIFT